MRLGEGLGEGVSHALHQQGGTLELFKQSQLLNGGGLEQMAAGSGRLREGVRHAHYTELH